MKLEAEVANHERAGCRRADRSLGFRKMPDGYALMLDSDEMYFYWLREDGCYSPIDWNKWRVRRGALANARKR